MPEERISSTSYQQAVETASLRTIDPTVPVTVESYEADARTVLLTLSESARLIVLGARGTGTVASLLLEDAVMPDATKPANRQPVERSRWIQGASSWVASVLDSTGEA